MRLSKIKLAGFKSFVDPTTITFPSCLVGVVGPNGCGKSNVIDAVRWVMGESSATRLRGDSITDVIFNGSSTRKSPDEAWDVPGPNRAPAPDRSRKSEYTKFILDGAFDTDDVNAEWLKAFMQKHGLTEEDLKAGQ